MAITNEQLEQLILTWSEDYVLGIESLFDVELTEQQKQLITLAKNPQARIAVSSATGTGKTAVLCMLTYLFLMVLPDCRILITSPSYSQLVRVFSAELDKWHRKMPDIFQKMFDVGKEKVSYLGAKKYLHFASLVTASVENKESLQGGHSMSYVILCDEASGVSDEAFDILLGTLSTGFGGRFIQTSNPVRSSGRFYEIFSRNLGSWSKLYFSALDSPNVNKEWIDEMRETYGEDSDLYRMRVLGQFPRIGVSQYISADSVEYALQNKIDLLVYSNFPKIIGVDIARFGDDSTAMVCRQGPRLIDFKLYKGLDTMEVATKVAEFQNIHQSLGIYIDSIGVGAGTTDRCKQLNLPIKEVVVSSKSTEPNVYANLRAQLWGKMKEWLENGASLPKECAHKDSNLAAQLTSMEYGYNNKMQIQLLSKKDLKKMGHPSPDIADALSFTFLDSIFALRKSFYKPIHIRQSRYLWA